MSAAQPSPSVLVEEIVDAVLVYYSAMESPVSMADLVERSRERYVVKVRAVTMWLLKTETHLSYPVIGRMFERDHTSVLNLCRRVHDLVPVADLEDIKAYVQTRVGHRMLARHDALMADVAQA